MAERRDTGGTSTDRLAFLLALVPYLIDQVSVTVDEAAEHFGTSPERIRRAVELIAVSGVPDASGSVLPGSGMFDIDWDQFEEQSIIRFRQAPLTEQPRLSGREAAALIAGVQTIMALPDFAERDDLWALREKLARGTTSGVAPVAVAPADSGETLTEVRRAQAAGRRLALDYVSADGVREERLVDPVRLDSVDGVWYLRAWCLTREAERTFRVDRIATVRSVGTADEHPASTADPASLFSGSDGGGVRVEIELDEAALPLVADYLPDDIRPVDGSAALVRATVELSHLAKVGRLASRLGAAGRVVTPAAADEARHWAERAIAAQHRRLDF
ncbi:helix-turn-helix transcriptional regulator [Microcella sp.]|uniref:helix-turn-helix transcriptional regulator n=1 Tax=Microcella sp. TaxID=1913979 RepID=UPI00391AB568